MLRLSVLVLMLSIALATLGHAQDSFLQYYIESSGTVESGYPEELLAKLKQHYRPDFTRNLTLKPWSLYHALVYAGMRDISRDTFWKEIKNYAGLQDVELRNRFRQDEQCLAIAVLMFFIENGKVTDFKGVTGTNCLLASCALYRHLDKHTEPIDKITDPMSKAFLTRLKEIAGSEQLMERLGALVAQKLAALPILGETTEQKLRSWEKVIDSTDDNLTRLACAYWLWTQVKPEDILLQPLPDHVQLVRGETQRDFYGRLLVPWFLEPDKCEWDTKGRPVIKSLSLEARLAFCCQIIAPHALFGEEYEARKALLVHAYSKRLEGIWHLRTPDMDAVFADTFHRFQVECRDRLLNARYGGGPVMRSRAVVEAGEAWFMGEATPTGVIGTIEVSGEHIYPQFHYETQVMPGYVVYLEVLKERKKILNLLSQVEWLKREFKDPDDFPGKWKHSYDIEEPVPFDYSQRGLDSLVEKYGSIMLGGVPGLISSEVDARRVATECTPTVFYRFKRSRVEVFTHWTYHAEYDMVWYECPLTYLVVTPFEDDEPEVVVAGFRPNCISDWVSKCGFTAKKPVGDGFTGVTLWCLPVFRETNPEPFKLASDIAWSLLDKDGSRFKAAAAELELRRKLVYNEE